MTTEPIHWIARRAEAIEAARPLLPYDGKLPHYGPTEQVLRSTILPEYTELSSRDKIQDQAATRDPAAYWAAGISNYPWSGACDDVVLRELVLRAAGKWASRSYRMRSRNRVEFVAVLDTYPEHVFYWDLCGRLHDPRKEPSPAAVFRHILTCNTGGQELQLVQLGENRRAPEGFDVKEAGDWSAGGPIVIQDWLSHNAGWLQAGPHVRAAFAFSFFASLNDVFAQRIIVNKTMQTASTGALLCEGVEDWRREPGIEWGHLLRRRRFVFKNCAFLLRYGTQPIALLSKGADVLFDGCVFQAEGGQNWIDVQSGATVKLRNCKGTARVHVHRDDVGPVTEDATWTAT